MAREEFFTISQLKGKDAGYSIVDSDITFGTTGTSTVELSSVKISFAQIGKYLTTMYPVRNNFHIAGGVSASGGLSADGGVGNIINFKNIPTTSSGLKTGDLYTQTGSQIVAGGSVSIKVLCVL